MEMENPMNNTTALLGTLAAIVGGVCIAAAGSAESVAIGGVPLFALGVAGAFAVQWLAFAPAALLKSERYFDLIGSATFTGVALFALIARDAFDPRSLVLVGMVALWAVRLGSFLYLRIRQAGFDRRFRQLKSALAPFLMTWTLQGLWVSVTVSCALAALTATETVPLGWPAFAGTLVWAVGLAIEVVADRQKQRFRADPANDDRFIDTGLWAHSRHPNYLGEIVLWIGIALVALPALKGVALVTLISPLFVYLLLTRISGVRMLEARADRRWADDDDYQAYKAQTPALLPRLRGRRS